MQEKLIFQEGALVAAEDIAASLKPLIAEYFVGECNGGAGSLSTPSPTEISLSSL